MMTIPNNIELWNVNIKVIIINKTIDIIFKKITQTLQTVLL